MTVYSATESKCSLLSHGDSRHVLAENKSGNVQIAIHSRRGSRGGLEPLPQWWIQRATLQCPKETKEVNKIGGKYLQNAPIEAFDLKNFREIICCRTPLIVCKLKIQRSPVVQIMDPPLPSLEGGHSSMRNLTSTHWFQP